MSPTRRDLFRIAAGLGLTAAVPTTAERINAADILRERQQIDDPFLDPATFADEMNGTLETRFEDEWMGHICPWEHADERRAYQALKRAYPELTGQGITPLTTYQEEVYALALALYTVGLRHGAAFEHLRRAVVGETRTCAICYGAGVTYDGDHCETCGGTGLTTHQA